MKTAPIYKYTGLEIAVTGMACRFPDAVNPEVYWQNLMNGKESVRFFTEEEIRASGVSSDLLTKPGFVRSNGALLDGKYDFDPEFFGYSLDEAVLLDPQIRILHECVHAALEDAGCVPRKQGGRIGLYAGASTGTFWEILSGFSESAERIGAWSRSHLIRKDYITSLIAYKLGLTGPAVTVNTACSTSLVAIHLAARAILLGECDMAIAGASSLMIINKKGYLFEEGLIKSPDGHCRAFDKMAKGTTAGEGAGVVVLKSLQKAMEDRDHIYAIIKGSAINNDGTRKVGYNAPSIKGQVEVITEALHFASVTADTIGYVEAHGTGTQIGDPVELKALSTAYEGAGRQKCAIGSVKANIGHLDTAAGIAGFIKAAMALYHKQLPPAVNFTAPNPQCDFEHSPFYVNTIARKWENGDVPARAAVSSFGIGGTNAHVILEEAPGVPMSVSQDKAAMLLLLSAKNETSLESVQKDYYNYLLANPGISVADLAYTLQTGRETYACRKYLLYTGYDNLMEGLEQNSFRHMPPAPQREICFVFPGQGAQYPRMAAGLYESYPVFRKELDTCFNILIRLTGTDYKSMIFSEDEGNKSLLQLTMNTQPVLFAWQYALAKTMMAWGIRPVSMIGHSVGEYVCASISGLFTLEQGLELVVKRGHYMQQMETGSMISVNMPWKELIKWLPEDMAITAVNSPEHCVAGGTQEAVKQLHGKLSEEGIHATILTTSHAFHSPMMEEAATKLAAAFENNHFGEISIPYVSNLNGDWVTASRVKEPAYWARHLRNAVQLEKGLSTVLENENVLLMVFGPEGAFDSFVKNNNNYQGQPVVSLLRHPKNKTTADQHFLVDKIGQLWLNGVELNWEVYYEGTERRKRPLPGYHFRHRTFAPDITIVQQLFSGNMKGRANTRKAPEDWCLLPSWKRGHPTVAGGDTSVSWLIIGNGDALHRELRKRLSRDHVQVISVEWSNSSIEINTTEHRVRKGVPEDIITVLDRYTWSDTLKVLDLTFLEGRWESTTVPVTHLLSMTRAWQHLNGIRDIQWKVITDQLLQVNGDEKGVWELSVLNGALRVIPQEISNITTQQIDVSVAVAGVHLAEQVFGEVMDTTGEPIVAWRHNFRWLPAFEAVKTLPAGSLRVFREDEVIIITGGLGRIGFTLAKYFASLGCNIFLIGRTDPDQPDITPGIRYKQQQLKELKSIHPRVAYMQADVMDAQQLEAAVRACEEKWGAVTGIIHTAALINAPSTKCLIRELTNSLIEEHFKPRTAPLEHLHEIAKTRNIEFIITSSSLAAMLGGLGYFGYAAANACLDSWIGRLDRTGNTRWLVINWDAWNVNEEQDEAKKKPAIDGEGGPRVLHSILSAFTGGGQVLVSTHDFASRWDKWIRLGFREQESEPAVGGPVLARPHLTVSLKAPASPLEEQLVTLWKEVFGYEEIGIKDDFFELGGDSLKALGLLNKIKMKYAKVISLEDFFQCPAIADIARLLETKTEQMTVILPATEKPYYVASPAQRSQYFIQHLDADSILYNQTSVYKVKGPLDVKKLSAAFYQLIRRHEVLRTALKLAGETIVQQIQEEFEPEVTHLLLSDQQEIKAALTHFVRPFVLSAPPLIRLGIISSAWDDHLVVLDMHHIVTDGITHIIIVNDLFRLYYGTVLPALEIQYKDYAEWLNTPQQKHRLAAQLAFWQQQLSGELPRITLPLDYPRPKAGSNRGSFLKFEYSSEKTAQLKELAVRSNTTPFMVILAAFNILLSKLSGLQDILVGTPIAGRNHPELKQIAGMFVNTVVLRNHPLPDISFNDFLQEVRQTVLKAFDHQELPFDDLIASLEGDRELNRNPVFDVFVSYESFDTRDYVTIESQHEDLTIIPQNFEHATSKFDLTLYCRENPAHLTFGFEYRTDLFHVGTIKMLSSYFTHVLDQLLTTPEKDLAAIHLLTPAAKEVILKDFNNTAVPYPADATIVSLFEEQVSRTPDRTAIVYEGMQLTYRQLDERANQLANYLVALGIDKESLVAICLDRSLEMMIGMLAILKSGGAYVPIDPRYPRERISFMLADTGATVVLSTNDAIGALKGLEQVRTVNLDTPEVYADYPVEAPAIAVLPSHLAYIIYTSGTTGQPKGVMSEHRGIVNRLLWTQEYFKFGAQDSLLQKTTFCFDVSVWELCCPLIIGLKLVFAKPEGHLDVSYMKQVIAEQGITTIHFVPSMLQFFLENIEAGDCAGLLHVVCSGEALLPQHVQAFREKLPAARLYNLYGPTEAAVDVTCWPVPVGGKEIKMVPIGKPIANTQLYILDPGGAPVPVGATGELYIGGIQVARGYLNRPDLTAERFIPDPFSTVPGARLYKTGDVCRWLQDGSILYLGRIDDQVKIRGYRIELGEIGNALQQLPQVRQAAVLAGKDAGGHPRLIGYIVMNTGFTFNNETIRTALQAKLPDHMLPAILVEIAALPFTGSGKVDKKKLKELEISVQRSVSYVAPRNIIEQTLAAIWQQLLGIPEVGIHDNFFELGGHSLLGMRMIAHVKKYFALDITVHTIFEFKTIHYLAKFIALQLNTDVKQEDAVEMDEIDI